MKFADLCKRDNVSLPEWLSDEILDDEWEDSQYLQGNDIHKWELNTPFGFRSITLQNEVYTFNAYNRDNQLIFEQIVTPETQIIT